MNETPTPELEDDERVVGRVVVYRIMTPDGDMRDDIRADDGYGDDLDLPTAVGMLAIAQHTMLCEFEIGDTT
jgi:hypothetical protein